MLSTGSAAEKDSAFGKLHIGSGGIGAMAAWILTAIRALPGLLKKEIHLEKKEKSSANEKLSNPTNHRPLDIFLPSKSARQHSVRFSHYAHFVETASQRKLL
ncbi:hypothetical protein VTN49DRAFT_4210 [Thermomyces lanuginosus]|uniref:uncharacterized protein n=1 Tax=Thermomyces lanuginosus TaxID=5541 RepID=UPI0037426C33